MGPRLTTFVELLKPVTWFPPMWAFACGVVSVGGMHAGVGVWRAVLGAILAGPLVCGASQAVNDWYDREVDAINQPERPIPSGRVPGHLGFSIALAWSLLALAVGSLLGIAGIVATAGALVLAWAYSAPPLRFKRNGWIGNSTVAISYEGLAWVTGAAVAMGGQVPGARVILVAALYSIGAHGIMTLNDFKSVRGDRALGIRTLPVMLGTPWAARTACAIMAVSQLTVALLLALWGGWWASAAVGALLFAQLPMMHRFLRAVAERALWYSAFGVPLYVLGMMIAAAGMQALAPTSARAVTP